jgi:hypothetical protein
VNFSLNQQNEKYFIQGYGIVTCSSRRNLRFYTEFDIFTDFGSLRIVHSRKVQRFVHPAGGSFDSAALRSEPALSPFDLRSEPALNKVEGVTFVEGMTERGQDTYFPQ